AEIAAAADGTILGFRDRFLLDQGAYNPWGIVQPYNTVAHMLGPYRIKHAAFDARSVLTNKTPHAPYRGAGRPEAVFVMERMLDRVARQLGLDPADVRRRNLIGLEEMPYDVGLLYRDGHPLVYDTGDFPEALERALDAVGYAALRREQQALRLRGVYRGVGIAAYVEGTGIGPFESATVRVDASGKVVVATGACSQGQGHETTFAQIAADALGVGLADVTVIGGDTGEVGAGIGTFASRSLVLAGHVAVLDVDPETGLVTILRYVVAHDCGRVVNPKIVDGQIHGGVAQGVGGGLWETLVYDAAGQLLTASLMDYALPKARDVPRI